MHQDDNKYDFDLEKRLNTRTRPSDLKVRVTANGKTATGTCVNLSICGAGLKLDGFGLRKKDQFTLAFIVKLNNGKVTKLHFRKGHVAHVTNGITGVTIGLA